MFRHERPQAGRLRQFYQLGVEQIGGVNPSQRRDAGYYVQTDSATILSAWDCLKAIFKGEELNFTVEVNNLGGKDSLKKYNQALVEVLNSQR